MQPSEPLKKGRDLWLIVAKVFAAIGIITGFGLVVNQCRTEQTHVVRLQADSTKKGGLLRKIQRQADDALAYAQAYKFQRDSAITAGDSAVSLAAGKLTYAQQVADYFKGLVANRTLPAEVANSKPDLSDSRVVIAGLKTLQRETTLKSQNDGLVSSIAVRDAKILALRTDKLTLKEGLLTIKQTALPQTKQGFLFIKAAARKQAKLTVKQVDKALITAKESELEIELNH